MNTRSTHEDDRFPFEQLLALGQLNDVEFVSIQKGAGSEQCQLNSGLNFVAGQERVSQSMDFKDTAAVLANCDLLISSDSAVVHLVGAMGIPTWLALRWIPEWRWGLKGGVHGLVPQRSPLPATPRWALERRDPIDDKSLEREVCTLSWLVSSRSDD